jgi:ribosome-associated protein
MNIQQLQAIVIHALEDVKAQDIQLFDTAHLSSMFERLVIASGTSNRQTRALASSVRDKVKEAGGNVVGIEGEDTGEWVLVDLGDMVVHIMQAPIRAYYRLDELWGERAKAKGKAGDADDAPAAKPKRTSRRNDSANEALEKPKRVRKSAAASEDGAPVAKPRTRKPASADGTAPAAAPRSRARKPAEGGAVAVPRARKVVVAEPVATRTRKAAIAAANAPAKPAAKPRARKPVADPAAGTAPHTPRPKKSRTAADE